MMVLAGRIGVGSIAGVALAIYLGGVGSIFWMWVIAILSAINAYCETVLGIIYKEKDQGDVYKGGPSYYIKKGLGNKTLGSIYAILILISYIISSCALLAIALAPNIYWVWSASLLAGASSVMPQFFIPLVSYHSAPAHKVRNVGIIQSCLLIGILGSRVFSGFLADVWGWRSVYFVACVFMLGCFLMIHRMLPVLSARSQDSYAELMKSLLRLLSKYPYLRIASLRAALAYGSFFALWSCLAFRMKQEPFFASDDIIGALGLCGLAGASTVVFISGYIQKHGARFFSIIGGCIILAAWLLAFWGNDSYLWMITAILLIDAGMQCIHLSNQTSVVALDASAINRVNTIYMTIYFLGGAAGTFVSGLFWQHYEWTGVVGVGVAFTVASLLVNCVKLKTA